MSNCIVMFAEVSEAVGRPAAGVVVWSTTGSSKLHQPFAAWRAREAAAS
jgi:hypothetical protein